MRWSMERRKGDVRRGMRHTYWEKRRLSTQKQLDEEEGGVW